jgi:hypothetical protein
MTGYKTKQQMADEFNLYRTTFVNQVIEHGIEFEHRTLISPAKQVEIYEKLGYPDAVKNSITKNNIFQQR